MAVINDSFTISTKGFTDILDITSKVEGIIAKYEIKDGQVLVHIPGSTAAVSTIEYEPGLLKDLPEALERIAPTNITYKHDEKWQGRNGYAHVRASIIGNSKAFPVIKSELYCGQWQQIILIDFDNKPRTREIIVQIVY